MSRFKAEPRPCDVFVGSRRVDAINSDKCIVRPIGCGGDAGFEWMTELELKEYQISGLCVKCQRATFGGEGTCPD